MVDSKNKWKAWLYLSPALVLLGIFTVYPIFNTVQLAFLNGYNIWEAMDGKMFTIGIDNFVKVLNYPGFLTTLKTTILLCVLTVPISTMLALLIAVALNSIKALNRLLQTIFFLPYVTNSIAIGMVFATMFNMIGLDPATGIPQTAGIINNFLSIFGVGPVNWINPGSTYEANMFVMCVYIVWNALPFKILVLLGGLQSVNKQYYDAAKVDGTSRARVFWRITVPLLSPMISYVLITGFIGGFKEYSSVVGVFGEGMGPTGDKELQTMVGLIYDSLGEVGTGEGFASAAAMILFVIILAVTILNLKVSNKKVHYQEEESMDTAVVMQEKDLQKVTARQRVVKILVKTLTYVFLGSMALIVLFPFYWMIISSLKTLEEYRRNVPTFWPEKIMWNNYTAAFQIADLGSLFVNTVYVGVVSTILSLVITVLTAFAFARLEFKGKGLLFAGLLATMMIPGEMFTITNYQTVVQHFKWEGKFVALIIPFLVSVFYIYLLRNNFLQIPDELYYAAKVDGTSDLKYLWKVMIPLAMPTLISITILKMMGSWNSYMWPKLVGGKDGLHDMITNGLRGTGFVDANTNEVDYPRQMAAVATVSAPLFLVFIFLRKYIMKGVSRSGIKG